MDWFEIFKVGKHTDSGGHTKEWTLKDLEEIASSYNSEEHEAPIVIGHPEMDSPAYGWIEALRVEGEKLLAKPKQLVDQFKDWVRKGLYKKVSIALYPDLTLRHVGFLGGMAPAVKGLKQAAFGDKKAAWIIESDFFMDPLPQEYIRSVFQRIRDWLIDKFGIDEANRVISSYDIDALMPPRQAPAYAAHECDHMNEDGTFKDGFDGCVAHMMECEDLKEENAKRLCAYIGRKAGKMSEATDINKGGTIMREWLTKLEEAVGLAKKELTPDPSVKFTETDVQAKVKEAEDRTFAEAQKKIEAEKKEKEDAQRKLKAIEDEKRKGDITSFCEGLCKDGKLTPALRKIMEPIMIAVAADETQIEFSEGVKKSKLDGIKDFLTELPKVVTFKEFVPGSGPGAGSDDEKRKQLINQYMEKNPKVKQRDAVITVAKQNPELFKDM